MSTPFQPALGINGGSRVYADNFSPGFRAGKYMLFDRAAAQPHILQYGTQAAPSGVPALPTAAADGLDSIIIPGAFGHPYIEMSQTTAQTLMPTRHATKGLEIGLDAVNNESVEYVPGGNHAANPLGYLAGTDPGVVIRAIFEFADVSGSDQFIVGFRKQEPYAVPVSFLTTGDALYTDFVGIGFSGSANPNDVKTMSDIGNAGSTLVFDTLFNFADGGIHQLEVRIRGRVVRYFINGRQLGESININGLGASATAQPTVHPPLYTVTSGLFMVPFVFHRFDAAAPGAVYLRRLEIGQPLEMGLDPSGRNF